ncbi:uncharacterized protein TrAFT101_011774 [Trichoderma asperellum]|uniref:uncharacterized protein n=1 Tax=Trichoderma asperellum TaxID=101201 RepID=UPI003327D3A1|nr:hypothetical protein TrAFT101_011774 [Trichoderma asperellum]
MLLTAMQPGKTPSRGLWTMIRYGTRPYDGMERAVLVDHEIAAYEGLSYRGNLLLRSIIQKSYGTAAKKRTITSLFGEGSKDLPAPTKLL